MDNLVNCDSNHISAEVVADSICGGKRITSLKIVVPRIILAEFNTHRMFSKNFSSSRAIPSKKLRSEVLNDPFVPVYWGMNQAGMSAKNELPCVRKWFCKKAWVGLSKAAVFTHWAMEKMGLHKQTCNRILEPWLSVTGVVTATEWDNFFKLRCHFAAQPEMQMLAWKIKNALAQSSPVDRDNATIPIRRVHMPFIDNEDAVNVQYDVNKLVKISIARCCRASYNNFYGKKSQPEEDVKLAERLLEDGHMTPWEHVAVPVVNGVDEIYHNRNFRGWASMRSFVEPEDCRQLLKDKYEIDLF